MNILTKTRLRIAYKTLNMAAAVIIPVGGAVWLTKTDQTWWVIVFTVWGIGTILLLSFFIALGQVHEELRQKIIDADARWLEEITKDINQDKGDIT